MRIFLIFVLFFISQLVAISQDLNLREIYSTDTYYTDFSILDSNLVLLANDNLDTQASITNLSDLSEITFLKSGAGPGEIKALAAHAVDRQHEHIIFAEMNTGKVIQFDFKGNVKNETFLKLPVINAVSAGFGSVIITPRTLLRPKDIFNDKQMIAIRLNSSDLSPVDTLFLDLNILELDSIEDYERLRFVDLRTTVFQPQRDRYLVIIEGYKSYFLMNRKSQIIERFEIDIENFEGLKTIEHPQYGYGQKIQYVNYSFSTDTLGNVYLPFGSPQSSVPYGYIKMSLRPDGSYNQKFVRLGTVPPTISSRFKMDYFKGELYTFDGTTIYQMDLK